MKKLNKQTNQFEAYSEVDIASISLKLQKEKVPHKIINGELFVEDSEEAVAIAAINK